MKGTGAGAPIYSTVAGTAIAAEQYLDGREAEAGKTASQTVVGGGVGWGTTVLVGGACIGTGGIPSAVGVIAAGGFSAYGSSELIGAGIDAYRRTQIDFDWDAEFDSALEQYYTNDLLPAVTNGDVYRFGDEGYATMDDINAYAGSEHSVYGEHIRRFQSE